MQLSQLAINADMGQGGLSVRMKTSHCLHTLTNIHTSTLAHPNAWTTHSHTLSSWMLSLENANRLYYYLIVPSPFPPAACSRQPPAACHPNAMAASHQLGPRALATVRGGPSRQALLEGPRPRYWTAAICGRRGTHLLGVKHRFSTILDWHMRLA